MDSSWSCHNQFDSPDGHSNYCSYTLLKKSSQRKSECDNSYSTLRRGPTQQLQQQSLDPASDLYDRIELSPSTGQAEFISKTETDNTNNLSPHPGQHNINPSIDMQRSKSATITAASSKDIPSHDIESTFKQPYHSAINKRKKKKNNGKRASSLWT